MPQELVVQFRALGRHRQGDAAALRGEDGHCLHAVPQSRTDTLEAGGNFAAAPPAGEQERLYVRFRHVVGEEDTLRIFMKLPA